MDNNQENAETLVDFVQSMVVVRPAFHIFGKDMDDITEKVYGKKIKIGSALNGEVYQYNVKKEDSDDIKDTVEYGLNYGEVYQLFYGRILNDLCNKDLLEPGQYYIDCR